MADGRGQRDIEVVGEHLFRFLVLAAGTAPVILALMEPRYIGGRYPRSPFRIDTVAPLGVRSVVTLGFLAIAAGSIVAFAPAVRPHRDLRVAVAAGGYAAAALLSSLHAGHYPRFGVLLLPTVIAALLLLPAPPVTKTLTTVRLAVSIPVVTSFVAYFAFRAWASDSTYKRGSLGLTTRLYGVMDHANSLGPVALVYLILWWKAPRSAWRWAALGAGGTVLLLTQSKTSWFAAIVVFVLPTETSPWGQRWRRRGSVVAIGAVLIVSGVYAAGLVGAPPPDRTDTSVESFTGRKAIWAVAVDVWEESPVFGHGPPLWDADVYARFGPRLGFLPGHAHNQLMQVLGELGAVGVAAFAWFAGTLVVAGSRADRRTGGVVLPILVVMGVDMFSEVPLVTGSPALGLMIVTVVVALVAAANEDEWRVEQRPADDPVTEVP